MGLDLQVWNCDLCSFKFGILSNLDGKACSVKLSWPQGFVHYTVTIVVILKFLAGFCSSHSITIVSSIKISWPHGFVHLPSRRCSEAVSSMA